MNIKTVIAFGGIALAMFASSALTGCGGELETEQDELGQLEQGFQGAHRSANRTFGTRTASNNFECTTDSSTQVCLIPKVKAMRVAFTTPTGSCAASTAQINEVKAMLNSVFIDSALSGWSYTVVPTSDPGLTHLVNVNAGSSCTGQCNAGGADDVTRYSCFTGSTTGVTEDSGVVGNFVKHTGAPGLQIDYTDVSNRATTEVHRLNLLWKSIASLFYRVNGVGLQNAANANCLSKSIQFNLASTCDWGGGAECMLESFTELADTTHYGYTGAFCGI